MSGLNLDDRTEGRTRELTSELSPAADLSPDRDVALVTDMSPVSGLGMFAGDGPHGDRGLHENFRPTSNAIRDLVEASSTLFPEIRSRHVISSGASTCDSPRPGRSDTSQSYVDLDRICCHLRCRPEQLRHCYSHQPHVISIIAPSPVFAAFGRRLKSVFCLPAQCVP